MCIWVQGRQKEGAEVSDGYEPQVMGDSIRTPVLYEQQGFLSVGASLQSLG